MAFRNSRRVAVIMAIAMTGTGIAGTGTARATFDPRPGPVFNDPEGTPDQQYAIMRQIEANIGTAPKGSVIRIAVYSLTLDDFADELIAAHRRGVRVRILMDQHARNATWKRLVAELGGKVDTKHSTASYAALCYGGCMAHHYSAGKPASWLHSKYFLFSGGGKRTATVASANPTKTQAEVAWNNSYTAVGDTGLYNAYVKNFTDMSNGAAGKHKPAYYWTYGSNPKAYYWPKATGKSDTILGMLKLVTCSRAYPSQVRVAMFEWSHTRLAVAKRLAAMAVKGCKVTVIYTGSEVHSSVRSALAHSKVDVRDTAHGTNGKGYAAHYTHDKYLLIDGRYAGTSGRRIVVTGSANYTENALYHNDETDLKLTNAATYADYLANFDDQMAAIPAVAAKQRALGERPPVPVDPEEAADS